MTRQPAPDSILGRLGVRVTERTYHGMPYLEFSTGGFRKRSAPVVEVERARRYFAEHDQERLKRFLDNFDCIKALRDFDMSSPLPVLELPRPLTSR